MGRIANRARQGRDAGRSLAVRSRLAVRPPTEPSIVVCGSPRSGTTWLSEQLATIAGAITLFEPLHPTRTPAGDAGFGWWEFAGPDTLGESRHRYLSDVLAGRVRNRWIAEPQPLRRSVAARRLLVKFVRANGLLRVLAAEPGCLDPLVVIRHPLATVASQLHEGSWTRPETIDFGPFTAVWPHLAPAVEDLAHPEEYLAAAWAADVVAASGDTDDRPWWIVHHEHLRDDPAATIRPVLDAWGIDPVAPADWDRPSRTVRGGMRRAGEHGLDTTEVGRILAVVERFGVTAYGPGPDPVAPLPAAPSFVSR